MSNSKMLIDATHPEETRVVVQKNGRVEEFDFESAARKLLRGNIYLAKVTRVEPSLQAAFVDYGGNRHGFLAFNEIHPDYYQIPVADRLALLEEQAAAEAELEEAADRRAEALARRAASRQARGQNAGPAPGTGPQPHDDVGDDAGPATQAYEAHASDSDDETDSDDDSPHIIDVDDEDEGVIEVVGGDSDEDDSEGSDSDAAPDDDSDGDDAASEAHVVDAEIVTKSRQSAIRIDDGATITEAVDFDIETEIEATITSGDVPHPMPANTEAGDGASAYDGDDEGDNDSGDDNGDEQVARGAAPARRPRRRMRTYKIQEVIKRRQIILVQVVKEERGNKGAALTTYLSLAGRYTVLMPNTARGGGISRKITNPQDRKRLKAIANELDVPEGMGLIIRTAGAARTKQEIRRDFEYLLRLWESVREMTLQSTAPSLVYEEGDLIKRSIRDLYNKDVDEVIVAGDVACKEAADFMQMLMPSHAKNVTPYQDHTPLFAKFGVERQLNAMFQPQVTLRSGGYIVINQTEALVAIDVNSGKSTKEFSIEETALATNLEASDEIARQLKLRDLAGLIVIDFIDMEEKRNNRAVERRLKDALRFDRARIQLGRISHFGLMEMSRQRLRTGVLEGSTSQCAHCLGTGIIRSTESIALAVLRGIEDAVTAGANASLIATTTHTVALYILNNKRGYISEIEARHGHAITVLGSDAMQGSSFTVEKGAASPTAPRRPAPAAVNMNWGFEDEPEDNDQPAEGGVIEIVGDDSDDDEDATSNGRRDDGRRRRRRRGRGRGRRPEGGRDAAPLEAGEIDTGLEPDSDDEDGAQVNADADADNDNADGGEQAARSGRRRRRGRRGGRRGRERRAGMADDGTDASAPGAGDDQGSGEHDNDRDSDSDGDSDVGGDDAVMGEQKPAPARRKRMWDQPTAEPLEASAEPGHGAVDGVRDEVAENADDGVSVSRPADRSPASDAAPVDREPRSAPAATTSTAAPEAAQPEVRQQAAQTPSARHEIGSAEPRIERVVVGPDAGASPSADAPAPAQRKGWWQRRFGGE